MGGGMGASGLDMAASLPRVSLSCCKFCSNK